MQKKFVNVQNNFKVAVYEASGVSTIKAKTFSQ